MRFFSQDFQIPPDLRQRFFHLYMDVAWFGLLAGSSMAFISVFATRSGGSTLQIGLLSAVPGSINLLFTMPAGRWLRNRPIGRAVLLSLILHRLPYFLWMLIPTVLPQQWQVWSYIGLIALMTIPGTAVAVGFNALFAAATPPAYRAHVVGIRNAVLSLTTVVATLLCGAILSTVASPLGYQIVFGIGFLGAMMSTLHIWYLRQIRTETTAPEVQVEQYIGDQARPGTMRLVGNTLRTSVALRVFAIGKTLLRTEVLRGGYGGVVVALFIFHFAQYLPIAMMPIHWVQNLHFSDFDISLGNSTFQAAVLVGSLQFSRVIERLGYHKAMVIGIVGLSAYPLINAFMTSVPIFMLASVIGGIAWSMLGGSIGNFLLERTPANDRPAYLAWYNLALNAGILTGSLVGPLLSQWTGVVAALVIGALARTVSAYAVWRVK